MRRWVYGIDGMRLYQPRNRRKAVRRVYLPLPNAAADACRPIHIQANEETLVSLVI